MNFFVEKSLMCLTQFQSNFMGNHSSGKRDKIKLFSKCVAQLSVKMLGMTVGV